MATVPGPPTSLAQVRAVFGAPAGTPLHAFVRGGAYVPNIAANNGVPTAPPLRLAQLAGATNYTPPSVTVADVSGGTNIGATNAYIGTASPTITGGNPIQTYQWTYVSGTAYNTSSTTASTIDFHQPGRPLSPGSSSAVWKLTVYDGVSTVTSPNFNVFNTVS